MTVEQALQSAQRATERNLQSLDEDQVEAARMDGAGPVAIFFFTTLPHLKRAISVVIMIEMIFLLTIFAEIFVTTSGGPGHLIPLHDALHHKRGAPHDDPTR